jgi:hypothetical protein
MSTESTDWVPGDPLHRPPGHHYGVYLYNFRDQTESETCRCVDAASWPVPDHGDEIDPPWAHLRNTEAVT